MSIPIKLIQDLIHEASRAGGNVIEDQLRELHKIQAQCVEELNKQVALKYARSLGLKPIETLEDLRKKLNEKIIIVVKSRKLKHRQVAAISQIYRPRVTHIMNRHLERVSLDMLIIILDRLGIDPKNYL